MIKLLAETPGDQEMIEKFQRAYNNLIKIVDKLQEENRKIVDGLNRRIVEFEKENKRLVDENSKQREELEEYRKRHPATVGVKNGKTYDVKQENAATGTAEGTGKRKQGAQQAIRDISARPRR